MPEKKVITLKRSKKFQRTELRVELLFAILNYINKIFKLNSK